MKLGIIGGSGLENPSILKQPQEVIVDTPYGKPSSVIMTGKISNLDVCILSRHGKNHELSPTQVNYRANISALQKLGCTHIIATTACGSLKEEIKRGDFVIIDSFIDFTKHRKNTFHDSFENGAIHPAMSDPFSQFLRDKLIQACQSLNFQFHPKGTLITIEGPRFSTLAESMMYRTLGADVVNMSVATEAALANEADIEYAAIAMSTDYDCWKQDEEPVVWDKILEVFSQNVEKVTKLIVETIDNLSLDNKIQTDFIKSKIRTIPNFPKPGIMFRDVTTLFKDGEAMQMTANLLHERYKNSKIDAVAGIESRGFILGAILAEKLGCGFIPIRKKGKLPADTIQQEYDLEYGTDIIELHKDAISPGQNILLVDDLIATGGTAAASCQLIEKLGGKICECSFIVELTDLKGRQKLTNYPIFSLLDFEGD